MSLKGLPSFWSKWLMFEHFILWYCARWLSSNSFLSKQTILSVQSTFSCAHQSLVPVFFTNVVSMMSIFEHSSLVTSFRHTLTLYGKECFFHFFTFVCLLRWQFSCQFVSKYMQIKRFSLLINWCQVGWSFWISYKNADLNEALVIWKEHETGCTYSNHKLSFMTPGDSSDEEWLSESGIHLLVIVMREIILSREMQSMCGLLKVRNRCIG